MGSLFGPLLFVSIALAAFAPSTLSPVGSKEIAAFLTAQPTRDAYERTPFETRLAAELAIKPDIRAASEKLAPEFALSQAQASRLSQLTVFLTLYAEHALFGYDAEIPSEEMDRREKKFQHELRDAYIAFVRDTKFAPVALTMAAKALGNWPFDCAQADFDAIVADAGPAVAWDVAEAGYCSGYLMGANAREPMNAAILYRVAGYGLMSKAQRIAVLEHIRTQIPHDADHVTMDAYIARELAYQYWDVGLVDDGLRLYDSLPPDERQILLAERQAPAEALLGGHKVRIPKTDTDYEDHEFHEQLAAALIVKGRAAEARTVLASTGKFAADAKALFACKLAGKDCSRLMAESAALRWVYLDHALNHPTDDPYDLFEQARGAFSSGWGNYGLWMELLRATMQEAPYRTLVDEERQGWQPDYEGSYDADKRNALEATLDPKLRARIVELRKTFDDRARAIGGKPWSSDRYTREAVAAPEHARFRESKLPPCTAARPKPATLDAKTLPPGYTPVRTEQQGAQTYVVGLSQNYDPSGEVSGGGFWLLISNDGGKTWDRPLYTGLPQFFPYNVAPESCLPLIAGDHLQMEVAIKEIDTASISYPPVALRSRREQSGLYLDIALSELRKDSDRDGLTDIAEENLLLDPNKADSDGDGVADGQDPFPNVAYTGKSNPIDGPMTAVLNELAKQGWGALIEPIGKPGIVGGWAKPSMSLDRPMFLAGNKADFGGFTASQMTLIYSSDDLAKFRKLKPDFHAMSLTPLILNRAGTRGFISWSAGWVGGMFRVVKDGDNWRVEVLSSWTT